MRVRFLRVVTPNAGMALREPLVIAAVDDHLVKLNRRDGWTCDCPTEADHCEHVDAIDELIDDRVIGGIPC